MAVHGISASLAHIIVSEIGTDMARFPTEKDVCSWLGLAPHNDISGGIVLRSRTLKTHNRAGQAFRQAAASVIRADCAFGAFYRRLKSRLGPAQAVVATAHKIARVVYHMLTYTVEYQAVTVAEYEQRFREREITYPIIFRVIITCAFLFLLLCFRPTQRQRMPPNDKLSRPPKAGRLQRVLGPTRVMPSAPIHRLSPNVHF